MRRKEKEDIESRKRSREIAALAELAAMSAAPIPDTWSARMPAYCYTELCPDAELREPPDVKREETWITRKR